MGVDQLGDRADLAGADHAHRLCVLALDAQHLADALLLATLGIPDVVVRRDLAREDAEVGQPADERVGSRLEDARQQRTVGLLRDLDLGILGVQCLDRPLLVGGGEVAHDRVEQAVDADVAMRPR